MYIYISLSRFSTDDGALNGIVPFYSGSKAVQSHAALAQELHVAKWLKDGVGKTADPLTEEGYKLVAAEHDDDAMSVYIRRVLESEGQSSADDSGLSGIVPFYSGSKAVQSHAALKQELRTAKWVNQGVGRTANLKAASTQQRSLGTASV